MAAPFVLRSLRVVLPDGVRPAALLIADGRIADVLPHDRIPVSARVDDVGSRVVMSGLIDTHVHVNEPGRTRWEGFETATQAAAVGGITTLLDMPLNSTPVTTTPDALAMKKTASENQRWVNVGFLGGLVPGNENQMRGLAAAGARGIKAFLVHSGIEDFPNAGEKELRAAMPVLAALNLPLLAHAEVDTEHAAPAIKNPRHYRDYLASRPRVWEEDAINLLIRLCREHRCRTHIVHLADADAIPALSRARAEGLPLTVETCPHYLFFSAEEIPDGATAFKCAPPIREKENRERLWLGLEAGAIDLIVSDHSPCTPDLKQLESGDFKKAWGGISSLQYGLPIVWTGARARGFGFEDLARWMSAAPARLAGLENRKGRIAPGFDADLVVWNPDVAFTVMAERTYHRHKVTPYAGRKLDGVVERTYLAGERIAENGVVKAVPKGQII